MQERCICCGAAIPEGRQICIACERFSGPQLTVRQPASTIHPTATREDDKGEKKP